MSEAPDSPRHIISRCLAENCDQLMPEQARRVIAALEARDYKIVKFRHTVSAPIVIEDDA